MGLLAICLKFPWRPPTKPEVKDAKEEDAKDENKLAVVIPYKKGGALRAHLDAMSMRRIL